ncbi:longevity assurance proteins LAG1/LAC1 [Aulographum hederae CBS 113979]|uniref:Longevity assurance proteins LAG1/LAC1 n=1 Tax=Aulographum hederae CBS 113979 TaxID=1176131 RepID=A0A6G1GJH0_9PEZI|nr:longevity assurance proteins LAG1/LAC1 [Aulographum hederae CBS 113979]
MPLQTPLEPFPAISTAQQATEKELSNTRRRRRSSGLGGEPRGDNAAPALATYGDRPARTSTPSRKGATEKAGRRSKRRKVKSLLRRWMNFSLRHTWVNPLIICIVIVSYYLTNPTTSNPVHAALFLSYPLPSSDPTSPVQYGKGARDFAFVAFYTVFLSFTREFLMQRVIRPTALALGVRNRDKQARFMEQAYTAIYFGVFGPFGMYVMKRSPIWYFNTDAMFEGFPHKTHEAAFKAYYLLQAAYWSQQAIVLLLMLEKPRKDFKELVAHHIITVSLIWLSYRFHFTYMGLAVYITHDISDFFLATSKVFNYLDVSFVGPYFGTFVVIWTYLRHYINIRILFSLLPLPIFTLLSWTARQVPASILSALSIPTPPYAPIFPNWHSKFETIGPYELDWDLQQYKCWISQLISFSLLAALQSVNLFWLFLILRIAWRYVMTTDIADERSEYGDSEDEAADALKELKEEGKERDVPQVQLNGTPVEQNGDFEKLGVMSGVKKDNAQEGKKPRG